MAYGTSPVPTNYLGWLMVAIRLTGFPVSQKHWKRWLMSIRAWQRPCWNRLGNIAQKKYNLFVIGAVTDECLIILTDASCVTIMVRRLLMRSLSV